MSGSRIAAIVVIVLVAGAIAGHFLLTPEKAAEKHHQSKSFQVPPIPGSQDPSGSVPPLGLPPPLINEKEEYSSITSIQEKEKSVVKNGKTARLAIIIDDMGGSLSEARALASINVPLTFAVIPGLRADKGVADFAHAQNIEIMIHIPMQSKGWPARHLESNGLLVDMDSEELQARVSGFTQRFSGAVGANNHMGSEFTEREDKMTLVLQSLMKNNLFFIDSVTSPESKGAKVARVLGMPFARRNVFLDNEQEREYILGQLEQAVQLARRNGSAIAIGHPHQMTIATLASALPGLSSKGVRLVPVSQLVK